MFNDQEKALVLASLEDKYKSIVRAQNAGKFPQMKPVYESMLRECRTLIDKVRISDDKGKVSSRS